MATTWRTIAGALGASCALLAGCPDAVPVVTGTGGAGGTGGSGGSQAVSCAANADCPSGNCVDGICCDTPCDGVCMACYGAKTGGVDGVCANILEGEDFYDHCQLFACDGQGSCQVGKRVFVTSQPVLPTFGGALAADGICQTLATTTGLFGNWLAWVSDSTDSVAQRFTHGDIPYRQLDGTLIAADWTDLTDFSLAHPILMTEEFALGPLREVWTGTDPNGLSSGIDCIGWTSADVNDTATVGHTTATDSTWTSVFPQDCGRTDVHLYCFEQ
jgi:hypothetical protein